MFFIGLMKVGHSVWNRHSVSQSNFHSGLIYHIKAVVQVVMLFILLYWRGVFILINIIIITENQYFVLGLIECLHKVFNKDFIKITRTNFQNYHQCLHDESSLPTFFQALYFCENITSKILKGDISTSKFKIIEMSKSVDELCRELLIDEYSQTNNRLSTLSPKEHRICT